MSLSYQSRTWVEVTPAVDTSAYVSGDILFTTTLIPGCGWSGAEPVWLRSVVIQDVDDEAAADMELYFFNASTSVGTINDAWNPSDAIMLQCVGILEVSSTEFFDYGGGKIAQVDVSKVMPTVQVTGSGSSLYVAGVTRGTPTYQRRGLGDA
jgi:hypothetical protein